MEDKTKYILDKVSEYADKVLEGIDPEKTKISFQLEKLKPVMEELGVQNVAGDYLEHAADGNNQSTCLVATAV